MRKTPVFGMVERGGKVMAFVTPDAKAATIFPIIAERVMPESTVYTDEYPVYDKLSLHDELLPTPPHPAQPKNVRDGRRSHSDHRRILESGKARDRRSLSLREPKIFADLP